MAIENSETRKKKNIKTVMDRNAPQLRIDVGVQIDRTKETSSTSEINIHS